MRTVSERPVTSRDSEMVFRMNNARGYSVDATRVRRLTGVACVCASVAPPKGTGWHTKKSNISFSLSVCTVRIAQMWKIMQHLNN